MFVVRFCKLDKFVVKLLAKSGKRCWKFGMLNDGKAGKEGKLEKLGMSMLDMLKLCLKLRI